MPIPSNERVYYAIQALAFASGGWPLATPTGYRAAKGVQSVESNVDFQLEQVYQLGQLEIYENIENIPNVELTVTKALDGYSLIQHLATPTAVANGLAGRFNDQTCDIILNYYDLTNSFASGTILKTALFKTMYVSQLGFSFPVDGSHTESVTLVGNNKSFFVPTGNLYATGTIFSGEESPVLASGGIQRRENIKMGGSGSYFPSFIPGMASIVDGGTTGWYNPIAADGSLAAHIQSVNISTNLGRTELFELGRRGPYFRYANFPTEVTCSIEITTSEYGDNINARDDQDNLQNEWIRIKTDHGIVIDLGKKNKVSSVSTSGGDTGGGNVTTTYNMSNFNYMVTTFTEKDPARL